MWKKLLKLLGIGGEVNYGDIHQVKVGEDKQPEAPSALRKYPLEFQLKSTAEFYPNEDEELSERTLKYLIRAEGNRATRIKVRTTCYPNQKLNVYTPDTVVSITFDYVARDYADPIKPSLYDQYLHCHTVHVDATTDEALDWLSEFMVEPRERAWTVRLAPIYCGYHDGVKEKPNLAAALHDYLLLNARMVGLQATTEHDRDGQRHILLTVQFKGTLACHEGQYSHNGTVSVEKADFAQSIDLEGHVVDMQRWYALRSRWMEKFTETAEYRMMMAEGPAYEEERNSWRPKRHAAIIKVMEIPKGFAGNELLVDYLENRVLHVKGIDVEYTGNPSWLAENKEIELVYEKDQSGLIDLLKSYRRHLQDNMAPTPDEIIHRRSLGLQNETLQNEQSMALLIMFPNHDNTALVKSWMFSEVVIPTLYQPINRLYTREGLRDLGESQNPEELRYHLALNGVLCSSDAVEDMANKVFATIDWTAEFDAMVEASIDRAALTLVDFHGYADKRAYWEKWKEHNGREKEIPLESPAGETGSGNDCLDSSDGELAE